MRSWATGGISGLTLAILGAAAWRLTDGVSFTTHRSILEGCGALAALIAGCVLGRLLPNATPIGGVGITRWRFLRACCVMLIAFLVLTSVVMIADSMPAQGAGRANEATALGFVAALSGLVGYAELAQRYRDDPARLFASSPTLIYTCVNVAAGVGAFALVREFHVFDLTKPHAVLYEILLAAFGAIAFFRSSLFTARVGDTNVDIGPSTLLKELLEASDRMINRSQASDRADFATTIMKDVKFLKARAALPTLCFAIVENITQEEQKRIAGQINLLNPGKDLSEEQCSVILGVYMIQVVGPAVLESAKDALGPSIK